MFKDLITTLLHTTLTTTAPAPAPAAAQLVVVAPAPAVLAAPTPAARKPAPAPVRVAQAPTAADVLKNVQAFYASIGQVKATFQQSVTNVTFGSTQLSEGTVFIAKPGKMRWDYYSKPRKGKRTIKKAFISNGTTLWVVEHDRKQIVQKNLEKDLMPVAVSFLYGKGDLATDFTGELDASKKYGAATDLVLKLTPKKPSAQYKHLMLVVDPSNHRVKESVIIDSAGNVNHFKFFAPDFAKVMQASWFEFTPKSVPSYRVVDADAQAPAAGTGSAGTPGK
ncbi:MAG: outer membrane lipoprotein carrier protein LolA [Kofleriaceae bacterium]|nr:outer membrane lipoprotein carrier protein LolA [Kofleriaceae bacterium]